MLRCLFNSFPNKPWFLRVCSPSPLKTLWKKENLLVTSIFSFPPVFSTLFENFLPFSSNLKLSSANSLSLEESYKLSIGKVLNTIAGTEGISSYGFLCLVICIYSIPQNQSFTFTDSVRSLNKLCLKGEKW